MFSDHNITAVLHFAGLKSVNESVSMPLEYYNNNISGTIILLETMVKFAVKQFVFSSSATVYGPPQKLPVDEPHQVGQGITNPYGRTKYFIEEILRDVVIADPQWRVTMLRWNSLFIRAVLTGCVYKDNMAEIWPEPTLLDFGSPSIRTI